MFTPRLASCARVLLLAAVPAFLAAAPTALGAAAADEQKSRANEAAYVTCMELARRAPQDAIARAEGLYKAGAQQPSRHCLATALLTLGRAAQAAKVFLDLARDMTGAEPAERSEAFGQAGRAWLEAGEVARAEAAYSEALGFAPNDALRLIDRAIARGAQGRDFEALDDLNRAVELAPGVTDARILRAAANRRVGAGELADVDIAEALRIDPGSAAAWLEKGLLAQSRKRPAEARAAFARAVELDPSGPTGLTAVAALKKLGVPAQPVGR
ncbi:MAG: hypothetical protein RL477_1733 [Pseudomonadota bacterium]|jgi:tetratricopeptide (TPR) repeat protein